MSNVKAYLDYGVVRAASYDDMELLANRGPNRTFRVAWAAPKLGTRPNVVRMIGMLARSRDDAKDLVREEMARHGHTVEFMASVDHLR